MNYINKADYKKLIQDRHLNQVIENNDLLLDQAERFAQATIEGYLSNIYDTSLIFSSNYYNYISGTTYSSGSTVFYNDSVYYATGATSGVPTGSTGYTNEDKRNQIIVTCMLDLALYEIHSRISPNNIPELRDNRKTDCLEMLKGINKGEITIDLPKKTTAFTTPFAAGDAKKEWLY